MKPDDHDDPVWVLTGPTASGKTALGIAIAEAVGAEIVSMDSMAVYRRMEIGTAKPTAEERARVRHHLIDVVDPDQGFDTARFCTLAQQVLDDARARGVQLLFVGGTPLYLMAFFKGMVEGPAADPALRAELEQREDREPGALHAELERVDPDAAGRIHRKDRRRLVRALEFLRLTGRPISTAQDHFESPGWLRPCRIVAIARDRDDLHRRVRARTEKMLDDGLLEETRGIEAGGGFSATAGAAIGYAECREFLRGRFKDREELRNRIRRSTHRLIRRQTTWLRRLREVVWLSPEAGVEGALRALETEARGPQHR